MENGWRFIGAVVIFICIVILGLYFVEKNVTCPQLSIALQKETQMHFLAGGCFIKLSNGNWISSDNYNGVNIENK